MKKKIVFHDVLKKRLHDTDLKNLSKIIGVPYSTIFDWVRGKRKPRLDSLIYIKRLADYLDLDLEELFLGEKSPPSEKIISNTTFSDESATYQITIKKIK